MQRIRHELVLPELGCVSFVEQVPVVGSAIRRQVTKPCWPVAFLGTSGGRRRHARWHDFSVQLLRHSDNGIGAAVFNRFRAFSRVNGLV